MINIVIPAAGLGSRFAKEGYLDPKPAIPVGGKRMIEWPISNFSPIEKDVNLCVIVQKSHNEAYNFEKIIKDSFNFAKVNIIEIEGVTDGALTTIMKAAPYFVDGPLICCNSDHYISDFSVIDFIINSQGAAGSILTFRDTDPKWSFADVTEFGQVRRVAEKIPISDCATVGVYYFADAWEFFHYAEKMTYFNIRHNGELYLCPIFNLYCMDNKKIKSVEISKSQVWGTGIPSDLEKFKKEYLGE